jgi:toxin ParE1/3/4
MGRIAEIAFHPEAAAEFDAALDWYRTKSEQAAGDFLSEVDDAVTSVAEHSLMWPEYVHGTRRYLLRHFPFLVVYQVNKARIEIVAIAHARRRPGYWSERVSMR